MKPIIYQFFPRWFTNDNPNPVHGGTMRQNGCGKLNDIDDKLLAKLRDLGATHVWPTGVIEHATCTDFSQYGIAPCNPHVVKGQAGSPYAIRDYYDISPELAVDVPHRMKEFEALVQRIHNTGLKIVLDFVPNHVARQYHSDAAPAGVSDLGRDDDKGMFFSPTNNFYYITGEPFRPSGVDLGSGDNRYDEFPARATGNDCFTASPSACDWYETIKLNYGIDPWNGSRHFEPIPPTWHKMLAILLFWAAKGVDAFRCDMAHMVPVEFWHWAIAAVKSHYPAIRFIAEIYDPALYHSYIHYGGFDYLYDKVTLYDTLFAIIRGQAPASRLTACWQSVDDIRDHMLNFLENHDELRIASPQFAGNAIVARPAAVVSATISRAPFMLYAGQELGETGTDAEGYSGPDGRTTIFDYWSVPSLRAWNNGGRWDARALTREQRALRSFYRTLLRLCNSNPALQRGSMFDLMWVNGDTLDGGHDLYAYLRHDQRTGQAVLVIANFSGSDRSVSVRIPGHAFDCLNLPTGSATVTDLLHSAAQSSTVSLSPDCLVPATVPAHDALILDIKSNN
ncbi:MAG: alpha-amylase [Muribaculaceae bacterium]|nr:alpha-amylase [Muribaculaceae bacterium]